MSGLQTQLLEVALIIFAIYMVYKAIEQFIKNMDNKDKDKDKEDK